MKKFKGKRIDNGDWVKGWFLQAGDDHFIVVAVEYAKIDGNKIKVHESYRVLPDTVVKHEGKIKNEKIKIYEKTHEREVIQHRFKSNGKYMGMFVDGKNVSIKKKVPTNFLGSVNLYEKDADGKTTESKVIKEGFLPVEIN